MSSEGRAGARRPLLFVNGKFYGGALNGVHRVADRLVRELDRLAGEGEAPAGWDMRLLLPVGPNWAPPLAHMRPVPQRGGRTQWWEQAVLPVVARRGALACFANLAPALHGRKLTMVHDAQFRISPESYPPKLRWGYRALVPRGANTSRIVATVSDYARDSLLSWGIGRPDGMRVIPNGADHMLDVRADPGVLARFGLRPGGYCLLFGATARYKNLSVVLDAFGEARGGPRLAVVGPDRAALAAAGLRAPEDAVIVGAVEDASLRALYEGALCLLFPSRTEGFGLPPAEAMLCGCPVVAAPAGAMPEVCRDAALYAGLDAPDEWRDAVALLAGDPDLRAAKIAAGRARAARFTWRAAGLALAGLLAPLVEEGAKRRGGGG